MLGMVGVMVYRWFGMAGIASINYKIEWNGIKLWSFGGTVRYRAWQAWYAESLLMLTGHYGTL